VNIGQRGGLKQGATDLAFPDQAVFERAIGVDVFDSNEMQAPFGIAVVGLNRADHASPVANRGEHAGARVRGERYGITSTPFRVAEWFLLTLRKRGSAGRMAEIGSVVRVLRILRDRGVLVNVIDGQVGTLSHRRADSAMSGTAAVAVAN